MKHFCYVPLKSGKSLETRKSYREMIMPQFGGQKDMLRRRTVVLFFCDIYGIFSLYTRLHVNLI